MSTSEDSREPNWDIRVCYRCRVLQCQSEGSSTWVKLLADNMAKSDKHGMEAVNRLKRLWPSATQKDKG